MRMAVLEACRGKPWPPRRSPVRVVGRDAVLAIVASELVGRGIVPSDLRVERPSLEDAFLALASHGEPS